MYNQYGFDESKHKWNDKLGNNFTDNEGIVYQRGMQRKNDETQGDYQAKVSGNYGEFTLSSVIDSLPDYFHLLNNYLIQTKKGSTQIDHILVSPWGIHVIETKNHKGYIFGDMNSKVWTQVIHNSYGQHNNTFYSPVLQNQGHLYHLLKEGGLGKVPQIAQTVNGIICFTNPDANLDNVNCFCCFTVDGLYQYLLNLTYTPILLNEKVIYDVIEHLDKTNTSGYINDMKHVQFVKEQQNKAQMRKQKRLQLSGF